MTNNERFNQLINSCSDPRRMMNMLRLIASKPSIQQTHDMCQESEVCIGELLPLTDVPQFDEQVVRFV